MIAQNNIWFFIIIITPSWSLTEFLFFFFLYKSLTRFFFYARIIMSCCVSLGSLSDITPNNLTSKEMNIYDLALNFPPSLSWLWFSNIQGTKFEKPCNKSQLEYNLGGHWPSIQLVIA